MNQGNCDHLAHYRPHVAASSDATAAVSQSAHAPEVWLSLINTLTLRNPAGPGLIPLFFNLLWLNSNSASCLTQQYVLWHK